MWDAQRRFQCTQLTAGHIAKLVSIVTRRLTRVAVLELGRAAAARAILWRLVERTRLGCTLGGVPFSQMAFRQTSELVPFITIRIALIAVVQQCVGTRTECAILYVLVRLT